MRETFFGFFIKLNVSTCFIGVCYQEDLFVWGSGLRHHGKAVEIQIPGGAAMRCQNIIFCKGKFPIHVCNSNSCYFSPYFSRDHLSFSFSFFVHGESSVCTAVEIQQQQRVRHLTLEDVAVAAAKQEGLPGIT